MKKSIVTILLILSVLCEIAGVFFFNDSAEIKWYIILSGFAFAISTLKKVSWIKRINRLTILQNAVVMYLASAYICFFYDLIYDNFPGQLSLFASILLLYFTLAKFESHWIGKRATPENTSGNPGVLCLLHLTMNSVILIGTSFVVPVYCSGIQTYAFIAVCWLITIWNVWILFSAEYRKLSVEHNLKIGIPVDLTALVVCLVLYFMTPVTSYLHSNIFIILFGLFFVADLGKSILLKTTTRLS